MIEDLIETGQYKEALRYLNDLEDEKYVIKDLFVFMVCKNYNKLKRRFESKSSCRRNVL